MASQSPRNRLPFEPRSKKKKVAKKTPAQTTPSSQKPNSAYNREAAQLSSIPDVVSKRMVRRMALFAGIPTAMGVASFFVFYWIISHQWFEVPTSAVVFTSMGLFGLGVAGLSYGLLSASWDEDQPGGWWGGKEFRVNFGRMLSAWRAARKEAKQAKQ